MVQVLEYPWNGVALDGGLPNVSSPTTTANPFYFFHSRNIERVRVYLNPRTVMPVGSSTIPGGVQTSLAAIADAARATVSGTPLTCDIEWALAGCTEPTSATESRRPFVTWLENFWEKVDDLLGAKAATWGYALLTQPRTVDLWASNSDPDSAVAAWSTVSWSPTESAGLHTAPWLEAITLATVSHLRVAGATKNIIVPTVYNPGGANPVRDAHPAGPWVDDADVYYEATVTPMGTDGYSATTGYPVYNAAAADIDFGYRDIWYESAYFAQQVGASSVLDPLDLNPPPPLDLDPETPPGSVALPPTAVTAEALNGGAKVSWTQPTFFGDGDFLHYQVEVTETANPTVGFTVFRTEDALYVNAGPFPNNVTYTASVYTVTTEGFSAAASVQFTPLPSLGDPVGGWHVNPTGDEGAGGQVTLAEPKVLAFPEERNFRPANWLKTPDEVEEGF